MSSSSSSKPGGAPASAAAKKPVEATFSPLTPEEAEKKLLPLAKVEAIIRNPKLVPGAPWETEMRFVDGRLQEIYKNVPLTGREIWREAVRTYGHRQYLGFEDEAYTYREIDAQVHLVARWLRLRYAVRKGDRVGIISRNNPEFIVSYWAVHLLGAVVVPINAFGEGETLAFCIGDAGCRVVICDVERLERLRPFLAQFHKGEDPFEGLVVIPRGARRPVPPHERAWLQPRQPGIACYEELARTYSSQAMVDAGAALPEEPIAFTDHGSILFTSGTTGKPKGVLSTQSQHFAALGLGRATGMRAYLRRGYALPDPLDDANQPRILLLVPLFHVTGIASGLITATRGGAFFHVMNGWNLDVALASIQKHEIQGIIGIGFMVREIMNKGTKQQLKTLSIVSHGGASATSTLPSEVEKARPGTASGQGYGMTELNGIAASAIGDDYALRPTSTGLAPPGVDLAIMDPATLVKLPPNTPGEIWVRSPGVALGYWKRPEATREAFTKDGWLRTGDIGRLDEDGFLYVEDRLKNLIIRGGENISTAMVEDAIYKHPAVQECAVVPFPDEKLGERVAAVIQTHAGAKVDAKELDELAAKHLPKFARPEYYWIRSDELPHNPTGKVEKIVLKKEVKERIEKEGGVPDRRASKL